MQKSRFIAEVAERASVSKKDARHIIETMLDVIRERLQQGDKVVLTGFGTFEVRSRQERQGVNPKTGEHMRIPATKTPGFSASNSLKTKVRGQQGERG
ncbi:MAG: transcriptional regulator [Herpetosiphonaceae bacterium]|nr:MAG: transcriptional regulator [Herpetosiphonaceae bacterium]